MSESIKKNQIFHGTAKPGYLFDQDVYNAALDRIRWLYDEFDGNISVSNSGGKDSTVLVELCAIVAKEKDPSRPLRVMWLDQECEFESTVTYQRHLFYERPDIDFRWYQVPFQLENATNHQVPFLNVWGEGEEWVRDREPNSIHENTYGQQHFYSLLRSIAEKDLTDEWCLVDGMRIEESPTRRMVMTSNPSYKWVTWSSNDGGWSKKSGPPKGNGKDYRFRFHPLYDWSYRDIWKAIYDHGWKYNTHYDEMYRYGVPVRNMRVSNYHHETALNSLTFLQEVEPETWERATRRLQGISTYGHIETAYPEKLPYMFTSWDEYALYLIENLTTKNFLPIYKKTGFEQMSQLYDKLKRYCSHVDSDELAQWMILCILRSDYYGTTINNYMVNNRKNDSRKEAS